MPWQKGKQLFKGNQLRVWLEKAVVNRIVNSCSLSQLLETAVSNSECFHFGDILTAHVWGPNVMEYLRYERCYFSVWSWCEHVK